MKPFDNKQELIRILKRYENGEATPEEKLLVEKWYESFHDHTGFTEKLSFSDQILIEQRIENVLRKRIKRSKPRSVKQIFNFVLTSRIAAASVILLIMTGLFIYLSRQNTQHDHVQTSITQDLKPGGNKATLTLSDGSQISLDSAATGMLALQGNTSIHKLEDGLISYTRNGTAETDGLNTIVAPAGGKYSVELSDGSRVWLNSESSITFPAAFSLKERIVKITGEVYFDIKKDTDRPFFVQVDAVQRVKVLGTQFNINAYKDEGIITTTLFQGSVEIINQQNLKNVITLKPGEQSAISGGGDLLIRNDVNTEEILAWKNGIFQFENTDITTVMRQLGRWYNVEISFSGEATKRQFSGKIDRNMNASQVFEILKFTGLNFIIESLPSGTDKGKVIVLP